MVTNKIKISISKWCDLLENNYEGLHILQGMLADDDVKEATIEFLPSYIDDSTIW